MIGGGGYEVSTIPVIYPRGTVIISSLGSFSTVDYFFKPFHTSLTLSIGEQHIQNYFKKKRGRKRRLINPQKEKARHEEQRKQMRVTVRAKLVVGYLELVPVESGADWRG